jgi:hypothetical protein
MGSALSIDKIRHDSEEEKQTMIRIALSAFALAATLVASIALAGEGPPPTELPEPGTLGLLAMGVAGIVAATRLRRRK